MPELPEVECVRRTIQPYLVGRKINTVTLHRADIVQGINTAQALLEGSVIDRLERRGKQLALISSAADGSCGRCVVIHLGMSGQLRWDTVAGQAKRLPPQFKRGKTPPGSQAPKDLPPHTHVVWALDGGRMRFTDPRRFGSVKTFDGPAGLAQSWARLGPDALTITPGVLCTTLSRTRRPLKAALLDQAIIAGLGNIYVDELLFAARLSPMLPADRLTPPRTHLLVRQMRAILGKAIEAGGSTLRDYANASGATGSYQRQHKVYGHSGDRCPRRSCPDRLAGCVIAGRTTVYCPHCQGSEGSESV